MAGTNKLLKEGQVLFKAGEKSDGMYLIRRGELRVYLEQDGKEVQLALIGEGGMIGEMALFDNQPRSASVKANKETEVTFISLDDFGKLMKQIPKWFVGLMSGLSSRLRQTNERLKKIESGGGGGAPAAAKGKPFQNVVRQLNVLVLLWHKDGEKDGKDWILQKAPLEKTLLDLFNEDPEKVKTLFDLLVRLKVLTTRQDSYKNIVYATQNRAQLNSLAANIATYAKANPAKPCLSEQALAMIRVLERMVMSAPYDTSTVAVADLMKEAKRDGLNTTGWENVILTLQNAGEEVKVVKTSSGPGLRTTKKDVSGFVRNHEVMAQMYKANLA